MLFNWLKEQKRINILRYFTYSVYTIILFILGVLLSLVLLNCFNVGNLNDSFLFNKRPTVVITGSMTPEISVNSVVILEQIPFSALAIGDIICYDSYNNYSILHRVVHKTPTYVVTKGDANQFNDSFVVTAEQITGRVVSIHNKYAPIISTIFGVFDTTNVTYSVFRILLGFVMLSFFVLLLILFVIFVFETITITYFFKKYSYNLVISSSYWLDDIPNKDSQFTLLSEYTDIITSVKGVRRVILMLKFRRYYNGLCNIEEEVNKTKKRQKSLLDELSRY